MLDEIREYEEWTKKYDVTFESKTRFILYYISDNFRGIKRPLTIVARHFMFEDGIENPNFDKADEAVRVWLGLKETDNEELNKIHNMLLEHCLYALEKENENKTKGKSKIEKEIEIREQINGFQTRDYTRKVDYIGKYKDELFIEDVIAQASADGPLRKLCLVADVDIISAGIVRESKESKKSGDIYKRKLDRLYKVIAAYLLKGGHQKDFVKLPIAEIDGWFLVGRINSNKTDFILSSTEDIYLNSESKNGKADKSNQDLLCKIDKEILNHFSIEDENDILERCLTDEDFFKNHIIYRDTSEGLIPLDETNLRIYKKESGKKSSWIY